MSQPGTNFLLRTWLLAAGSVLALSLAVQAKAVMRDRTQVFVVGMADDLAHQAGTITQILRKVMRETPKIQVLDLTSKLQAKPPPKIKEFLDKARSAMKAAKQALREMEFGTVVKQATLARQAFEKMGGFIEPLARYKESIMLIAVGRAMLGDKEQSKRAFIDLLLFDPHLKLSKTAHQDFVINLFNEVKASLAGLPLGSVAIKTNPPGGNLYLDGKLKGVTPESLDGLVAGNHLLVVKMPGFQNWGKVIKVDAGNLLTLDIKMIAGAAGGGFARILERAGRAVSDSKLRGEVLRLGQTLGLDWAWLCQLKHGAYEVTLTGYLFEFSQARVLHQAKLTMDVAGYGMEEEVRNFGRKLIRAGLEKLRKFREEGDPLAGQSGTEDWYNNESKNARKARDKRAHQEDQVKDRRNESGDPLDDRDGTEDW
ncbi:MAG TPA: PEGA domain-containing protein [Myxococcota bacterium]|nr:PEGA domain-containing protein [Myxococcota bacterium]